MLDMKIKSTKWGKKVRKDAEFARISKTNESLSREQQVITSKSCKATRPACTVYNVPNL